MLKQELALVTGGSGYFGSILVRKLVADNIKVRVLDLNYPEIPEPFVEYIEGDVRDFDVCMEATTGVDYVFHNIAQVPLAKNSKDFFEVNINGTRNICDASIHNQVKHFIYTSSSAVYGIPANLPVMPGDPKVPIEDYGRAKLEGELICQELGKVGIQVKIIRPRTILGLGRLGIFGILFGWIKKGINIYTLGEGNNPYQFIHAEDLAAGVICASKLSGNLEFNLGALEYGTLKEDLQGLCDYAQTGSRILSLNEKLLRPIIRFVSLVGLLPFASYQLQLYSKPMYFDSDDEWGRLGYVPKFSNLEMLIQSYEHFLLDAVISNSTGLSHHQKTPKSYSLLLVERILRVISRIQNWVKGTST